MAWSPSSLLGRLSERGRVALIAAGTEVRHVKGYRLIRQGDSGEMAFLITDGAVKVQLESEAGTTSLLGIRTAGDLVGETGALEPDARRTASVVALTDVVLRAVHHSWLRQLMIEHPEIGVAISRMISERLRWANRRRVDATIKSGRVKLSRLLVEAAELYGERVGSQWHLAVPLTQHELGSMAGLAHRTVEKALRELVETGLIKWGYRSIRIVDLEGLRSAAE